jgi:hypothetical protein
MNSGLNLQFSHEDIVTFLQRNGYKVEKVKTYYVEKIANDKTIDHECEIFITYKKSMVNVGSSKYRPDKNELKQDAIYLDSRYGLGVIFSKLIKEKLLKLK